MLSRPIDNGFIAVDWGTTRFRAYLIGHTGDIVESVAADEGISTVTDRKFAEVLESHCSAWFKRHANIPIVMAGMIGSRNGWVEVPYVPCPTSLVEISGKLATVSIGTLRSASIVPGVICRSGGVADVMRGEETLVFGTAIHDGIVVVPGTHSKWITLANKKIVSFRTYLTGEVYWLLRHHSVLRLLAQEPDDLSGVERGFNAAVRIGGLLHQVFEARTAVLDGGMTGAQVGPFLSGLLIASEVQSATDQLTGVETVTVIADGELAANYSKAFERCAINFSVFSPQKCLAAGLRRILEASI